MFSWKRLVDRKHISGNALSQGYKIWNIVEFAIKYDYFTSKSWLRLPVNKLLFNFFLCTYNCFALFICHFSIKTVWDMFLYIFVLSFVLNSHLSKVLKRFVFGGKQIYFWTFRLWSWIVKIGQYNRIESF